MNSIGEQHIPRREDERLLRGGEHFTNDLAPDDAFHLVFVRSSVARANIVAIDIAEASEQPGVEAIFLGKNVQGLSRLPVNPVIALQTSPAYPLLACTHIEAVGQAYAVVVASSINAGLDAAEHITIQLADDSDTQIPSNNDVVFIDRWADDDFDKVFNSSEITVSVSIKHARLAPSPLETRSIVVQRNAHNDTIDILLSTQTPHRARQHLAEILDIDQQRLHIRAPDVGGAFGLKASLYPEEVLAVWITEKLGKSVRWQATRSEDMLSATHGRGAHTTGTLVLSDTGKFLALRANIQAPLGHWLPNSAAIPAWNAGRILPGPYHVDAVSIDTKATMSNTAAIGIYRGAGRPEAAMLMERLVDKAARLLNMDPVTLRIKNFIDTAQMPYTHTTGARLDTGNYEYCLNKLCELAEVKSLRIEVEQRRGNGELVGIGLACFVEPCGSGWESANVKRLANGHIIASTGGSSQGHGRETAYAQIISAEFNVSTDQIEIRHSDTDTCPSGIGALASRSTAIGGSALVSAARKLKNQLASSNKTDDDIEATVVYEAENEAWGSGFYLALVSIAADTGTLSVERMVCVDEIGQVINPTLVEGQVLGGIAQGLGEALMEQLLYDENDQLMTGSLSDYALPRANDMPAITLYSASLPNIKTDSNLLGAKGVGEAGTIGAPAAIVNAAIDALSDYGVTDLHMPLTSEQLWRAMQKQLV